MPSLSRVRTAYERVLEAIVILLMVALTAIVVVAVIYRRAGASLTWYDEVASILLAWLTYYGAALAALKRAHIGFEELVLAAPPAWRFAFVVLSETVTFAFFILLAWVGWEVLIVLHGQTLVSLPQVPIQLTQSVIPIGAVLFVIAEALSLPEFWRRMREGGGHDEPPAPGAKMSSDGSGAGRV